MDGMWLRGRSGGGGVNVGGSEDGVPSYPRDAKIVLWLR